MQTTLVVEMERFCERGEADFSVAIGIFLGGSSRLSKNGCKWTLLVVICLMILLRARLRSD